MYDPGIGRWISEDPTGFKAGDSNLYRYVKNMPTTQTDPSGLQEGLAFGFAMADVSRRRQERLNWERGRTDSVENSVTRVLDGVRLNTTVHARWFTDARRREMVDFFVLIRDAIPRILEDLRNYRFLPNQPLDLVEPRVNRWFGNGRRLTTDQLSRVRSVFQRVRDGIDTGTTTIYDDSDTIQGYGRYNGTWFSGRYGTIQLGQGYIDGNREQKIGTLIHELTHLYANTGDYGYHTPASITNNDRVAYVTPGGSRITLTANQQVNNADSYAGFLVQYYT